MVNVLPVLKVNTAVVSFDQHSALPPDAPMTRYMIETIADCVAVHTRSFASNLICLADAPAVTATDASVFAA